MHEYEILEQTWRKYRTKKNIKIAIFAAILLFGGVGIGYFWNTTKKQEIKAKITKTDRQKEHNTSKSTVNNLLLPDLSFEKRAERYAQAVHKRDAKRIVQQENSKPREANRSQKLSQLHEVPMSSGGSKLLKAVSQDKLDLSKLQKQFAKTNDIGIALIIAKEYYKLGNYQEASRWALKANNIDKNNEESWVVFAKSAYKMGKKGIAMNALKIYYKKSHSQRALKLLRQMIQGQFR